MLSLQPVVCTHPSDARSGLTWGSYMEVSAAGEAM